MQNRPEHRQHGRATISRGQKLTEQEHKVACLIARGLDREQIAKEMDFAIKTYDTHRQNLLTKLGLPNNVTLTHHVLREGWIALYEIDVSPKCTTCGGDLNCEPCSSEGA